MDKDGCLFYDDFMKKIYRRLIFWAFFLLFVLSAPVVILYSQGYRFDQYSRIFIRSGSITIKSVPSSVNVYLNDKLQSGHAFDIINNSITLNGLRPGNYTVRVSANYYQDWQKQIEVHSGISSEYWNVFLAPQKPTIKELPASGVERFFPSPFGKYIAYISHNQANLEINSLDIKSGESISTFSGENVEFSNNKSENLEWNFKERLMASPVTRNNVKDYLITDINKEYEAVFLSDLMKLRDFHSARWSSKDQWTLYFLARSDDKASQILYKYNISTKELTGVSSDIAAFDFSGDSIYSIRHNNILYKLDLDGNEISQITSASFSNDDLGDYSRLIVYDENRQALVSQDGVLFVHNNGSENTIRQIADDVNDIQFSDDGKKMLFWGNNAINVLFLRQWNVQPQREENEIQKIIRASVPFDNVFWYRDYEHILFAYQNKIKVIELDQRDHRISANIFENSLDNFPAAYDSRNSYYYFVGNGSAANCLFQMQLPEKTGFFGG
jgi:hypothetical protein